MVRTIAKSKTRRAASSSDASCNQLLNSEDPAEEDVFEDLVKTEPRSFETEQRVFHITTLPSEFQSHSSKAKKSKITRKSNTDEGLQTVKYTKINALSIQQEMGNTASKRIRKPVNKFSPNPNMQIACEKFDPPNHILEPASGTVQSKKGKKCMASDEALAESDVFDSEETNSSLPQATTIEKGTNIKKKYCRSAKQISRKKAKAVSFNEVEPDSETSIRMTRYTSKLHDSLIEEASTSSYQKNELNTQKDPSFMQNSNNSRKQKGQADVEPCEGSTFQAPESPVKCLPRKRKHSIGLGIDPEETLPMGNQETESNPELEDKPSIQPARNKAKRKKQSAVQAFNAGESEETLSIRNQEIECSVPIAQCQQTDAKKVQKKRKVKTVLPQTPVATDDFQTIPKPPKKTKTKCVKRKSVSRSPCGNEVPGEQNLAAVVQNRRYINEDTTDNTPSESLTSLLPEVVPKKKRGPNRNITKIGTKKKSATVKKKRQNPNPPTIVKAKLKKLSDPSTTLTEMPVESSNNQSICSKASTSDKFENKNNTKKSSKRKSLNNNKIIKVKIKPAISKESKSKKHNSQPITPPVIDSAKFEKPRPVPISPKTFYNASATDECSGSSLVTVSTSHSWANISSTTSRSSLVPIHGKIPTIIIPRIDERGSPRKCTLTDTTTTTSQTDSSTSEGSTSDSSKLNNTTSSDNYSDLVQFTNLDLSISTDDENEALYKENCISCIKLAIKFDESSNFLEKFKVPLSYSVNLTHTHTRESSVNVVGSNKVPANSTRLKEIPKHKDNYTQNIKTQATEKPLFPDIEKTNSRSKILNTAKQQHAEKHVQAMPSIKVLNATTVQHNERPVIAKLSSNALKTATLKESEKQVKTLLHPTPNMLNTAMLQHKDRWGEIKRTFNTFHKSNHSPDKEITANATAGQSTDHIILKTTNKMSREGEPGINTEALIGQTSTNAVSSVPSSQSDTLTIPSHPQVEPTGFKGIDDVPVKTNINLPESKTYTDSDSDVLSLAAESISSDVSEKRPKGQRQKFVCEKQNADSTSLPCPNISLCPEDTCELPLPELNSKNVLNASPPHKDDDNDLCDIQPIGQQSTDNWFMFKRPGFRSQLFFRICLPNLRKQCPYGKYECTFYHIPNKKHLDRLKQILLHVTISGIISEYLSMREILFGTQAFLYYAREFEVYFVQKRIGRGLVEIMIDMYRSAGPSSYVNHKSLSALNTGKMMGDCYPLYILRLEGGRRFVHILLENISKATKEFVKITRELLCILVKVKEHVEHATAVALINKTCKTAHPMLIKMMYELVIKNTSSEIFKEKDLLKKYASLLNKIDFNHYYEELCSMMPDLKKPEDVNGENGSEVCVPEVIGNGEASPVLHCNVGWNNPYGQYNGNPPRINGPEHNYRISPDTTQHVDSMHLRPHAPRAAPPPVWNKPLWQQRSPSMPNVRPMMRNPTRWNRAPRIPFQNNPRF